MQPPLIIFGLGNPWSAYANTRHNLGARAVSALAARHGLVFDQLMADSHGAWARISGRDVLLLRSNVDINASDRALGAYAPLIERPPRNVWVLHDDIALMLGTIRIVVNGGAGGHRGVEALLMSLGSADFVKFKLGIGRPSRLERIYDYVFEPFGSDEMEGVDAAVGEAIDAMECAIEFGVDAAQTRHNRKRHS